MLEKEQLLSFLSSSDIDSQLNNFIDWSHWVRANVSTIVFKIWRWWNEINHNFCWECKNVCIYLTLLPTEKSQLLLKTMNLRSPNFVTFPIYPWQILLYPFGSSKWQKRGFYSFFCCWWYQFPDHEIWFFSLFEAKITKIVILD